MNTYVYTKELYRLLAAVIDSVGSVFIARGTPIASPKNIVIFRLDQLGDAFYCTPIIGYLNKAYPDAVIDIVTTAANEPLFRGLPGVGHIYPYTYWRFARTARYAGIRETMHLLRTLWQKRYDLAIDLRGEPFIALLTLISRAPVRIGIAKEEVLSFLYTHPIRYNTAAPAWHRFKAMLGKLGIETHEWTPLLALTTSEEDQARERAKAHAPFIMLHMSAGVPFKRWPLEYFDAISTWADNHHFQVLIVGAPEDTALSEALTSASHLHNYCGRLSLRETYALAAHAAVVIGNDSVVVHLAGPTGVPTLHLLSAASPGSAQALGSNVHVLRGEDPGHHCRIAACSYPCPHMQALTPDMVIQKLEQVV